MTLTFGSLFAGIGGFDLGFERAGMVCKWQVEIDPYCQHRLAALWPTVRRHDDVRTWPASDTETVDIICGGFPCQDISNAGLQTGIHGVRSGLFFEFMRIVRALRPRFVVLENVTALLDRGMDEVLGTLASLGYDAEWDCIPAAAVGAYQIRERIFVLAYTKHYWLERGRRIEAACPQVFERSRVCEYDSPGGRFKTDAVLADFARDQANWHREPRVDRVANGVPDRVDRIRCLGNAVVPQVAEWIGRRIVEAENQR